MDDATKRLIETAKGVVDYFDGEYWCLDALEEAIVDVEQQAADDAEPITPEWCGSRWLQSSDLRDVKEYCIFDSVCIRFNACVGGWDESEVYVGTTRIKHIKTRSQLRQLVKLLRGEQ